MVGGWHKGRIVRLFVGWFSTAGKLNSTNKSMLQKNRWRNLKVQAQDLSARGVHHPFPKITARTADACLHFEAQNIISVQCAAQICKVKLDQANVMSFAFCFTLVRLTWRDSYMTMAMLVRISQVKVKVTMVTTRTRRMPMPMTSLCWCRRTCQERRALSILHPQLMHTLIGWHQMAYWWS